MRGRLAFFVLMLLPGTVLATGYQCGSGGYGYSSYQAAYAPTTAFQAANYYVPQVPVVTGVATTSAIAPPVQVAAPAYEAQTVATYATAVPQTAQITVAAPAQVQQQVIEVPVPQQEEASTYQAQTVMAEVPVTYQQATVAAPVTYQTATIPAFAAAPVTAVATPLMYANTGYTSYNRGFGLANTGYTGRAFAQQVGGLRRYNRGFGLASPTVPVFAQNVGHRGYSYASPVLAAGTAAPLGGSVFNAKKIKFKRNQGIGFANPTLGAGVAAPLGGSVFNAKKIKFKRNRGF
jgi:hypothetical protein